MTPRPLRLAITCVTLTTICTPPHLARAQEADRDASRRLRRTTTVEAVEKVRHSVVNISSTQRVKPRPSFFSRFRYPDKTTTGSGFVIHQNGYIVTNDHVVARSTDHRVRFVDGSEYEAVVVARDRLHDLAVLHIDADRPLIPLELGRSDDIMLGEDAIAIGNPFGLENTITRGVISATNRTLEFDPGVVYEDLIQTDASIHPGNSGGPLLNAVGELIGVNTAIRADSENLGFAIPVDQLRAILPEMLDITKLYQVQFGMRVSGPRSEIVELVDGSPADRAGLRLGDIVLDVDRKPIRRPVDFSFAMLDYRAGDSVPIRIRRKGDTKRVEVRLTEIPKLDTAELAWRRLGLRLKPLTRAVAAKVGQRHDVGLVITDVAPRGPAARHDIRAGDLLVGLGRYRAWPLKKVGMLLQDAQYDDPADVVIYRFYQQHPPDRFEYRLYIR